MLKKQYEYKARANSLMEGKYGAVVPVMIIFAVITIAISTIQDQFTAKYNWETLELISEGNPVMSLVMSAIALIVTAAIAYSYIEVFQRIVNEEKVVVEEVVLLGVKENLVRSAVLQFITNVFIFLWLLLLIIPGIVKAYAYSMNFFLIHRKQDLGAKEAIDESKKLTDGHKLDLFFLDLSYLGWYFLGIFTLGILWLWIYPRHRTAKMLYFEEIYDQAYPTIPGLEMDTEY